MLKNVSEVTNSTGGKEIGFKAAILLFHLVRPCTVFSHMSLQ